MTDDEAITRLLSLSTQLEIDGKDMAALACTHAAARLMTIRNLGKKMSLTANHPSMREWRQEFDAIVEMIYKTPGQDR